MISNKEELFAKFGNGWHSLLEIAYTAHTSFTEYSVLESAERVNGMLIVRFNRTDAMDNTIKFILGSIEYRIERLSANTCEVCGKFGRRRTELAETQTLCTEHYALKYSIEHPAPSLVAHQEPQKD